MARDTNSSNRFDSGFGPGDASTSRTMSTVVGLFRDRDDAEKAIRALHDAGFSEREIGIAMRDAAEQNDISERTGATGEGAKKGAVSGGVVGGLAGLLGALLIPGLGPIVVAGWLGSTLVGAGIGAAAGGLIGGLIDLGVSEDEAHHFEKGVQSGGILVTVNAGGRAHEAYEILHEHDADLGPAADAMRDNAATNATGTNAAIGTMGSASIEHAGRHPLQAQRLQLKDEQLRVMKDRGHTGEARNDQRDNTRTTGAGRTGHKAGSTGSNSESWRGNERRFRDDVSYSGPERRVALR